jgi:hypothetical protein
MLTNPVIFTTGNSTFGLSASEAGGGGGFKWKMFRSTMTEYGFEASSAAGGMPGGMAARNATGIVPEAVPIRKSRHPNPPFTSKLEFINLKSIGRSVINTSLD